MILNVLHNSRAFYPIIIRAYCISKQCFVNFFFFPTKKKKEQGEGNVDVRLCLQPNEQEHTNKTCPRVHTLRTGEYLKLKKGTLESGFTFYLKVYGTAIFSAV